MNMFTVLQVILVVLKLIGMINIAWWQVFIPMYILFILIFIQNILESIK